MCRFKSGIILKNRVVIAEGENDSHSDLLEKLNIEDTRENAMRKFVRAELMPHNDEWWTDPETWTFIVDQDIVPDWFENDKERYYNEFKEVVKNWCKEHVLVNQRIKVLDGGYYRLKQCEIGTLSNNVEVKLEDSLVKKMLDDSIVHEMSGRSTIEDMHNNSVVEQMREHSFIRNMFDYSEVRVMGDFSLIHAMYGYSAVRATFDKSTIQEMHSHAIVRAMHNDSKVIKMFNDSFVQEAFGNSGIPEIYDKAIYKNFKKQEIQISKCNNYKIIKQKNK